MNHKMHHEIDRCTHACKGMNDKKRYKKQRGHQDKHAEAAKLVLAAGCWLRWGVGAKRNSVASRKERRAEYVLYFITTRYSKQKLTTNKWFSEEKK